jgi:phosphoglycerate dehydrogenase-like enzyme
VKLWLADRVGRDAVGELPDGVVVGLIPREGEPPQEILRAEFLVPGDRDLTRLLAQMPGLRVIQTLSAGVEWLLPALPPGVIVCDAAGARDVPVSEWVMAAILAAQKMLPDLRDDQRAHRWQEQPSRELAGSTVMILGFGSIGAAVEERLRPFGVELIRVARRAREGVHAAEELDALLPRADIVIVLLPLTPATSGLLDARSLSLLAPGALLVNAARGPIVDTQALLELLQRRRIRAVLDVTDPEPLPPEHPLWDAPGVLITPHLAGDTLAGERRAFELVGEQVRRYTRREPLANVVAHGY